MRQTKLLPIIIIMNCSLINNSISQWVIQNSGTEKHIRSVSFIDSLKGWAVGDSGTILYTNNGGVNWQNQISNTSYGLNSVSFCDSLYGWAVGYGGIKLNTSNGGINWNRIYHDTASNIRNMKVKCFDPKNVVFSRIAWYGDYYGGGKLWHWLKDSSSFSGTDWFDVTPSVPSGLIFTISDFDFVTNKLGYVIKMDKFNTYDWGPQVSKTTDGGFTWKHFPIPSTGNISFSDSTNGWLVTRSKLYEYSDSAITFNPIDNVVFYPLESVLRLGNIGYISSYGSIMNTTDGGINWTKQSIKDGEVINSIQFITPKIGWVVGTNGLIAYTVNGGVTSVNSNISLPSNLELYQNYPNPFNPFTEIEYSIPQDGIVSLRVYDGIGREVMVLVNELKEPGRYVTHWNATRYTSGIYYLKLQFKQNVLSKRMVLIK
jgi:photosystem II stability/assembly factor-like uncharacterized protein